MPGQFGPESGGQHLHNIQPSISTWIISTSGISSASSTFGRSAGTVTATARKVAGSFF